MKKGFRIKSNHVIIAIIVVFLLMAITFASIDYRRVAKEHKKALFAMPFLRSLLKQDGGSGLYIGPGYAVNIDGDLSIEYGYQIKEYSFYIMGIRIKHEKIKTDEAIPQLEN